MTTRDKLLDEINDFMARTGVKEYRIGAAVIGDPSFVLRLRKGRDPKASTVDAVRAFMAGYKPQKRRAGNDRAAA